MEAVAKNFDISPTTSYARLTIIAAAAFTALGAGSAGATSPNRAIEALRTTPQIAYQRRQEKAELSASEVLHILQDRFGLGVSQLAEVAQVSRPTIYGWLKSTAAPRNDEKAHRLDALLAIARLCNRGEVDSKIIGRLLRRKTSSGFSMLDLLLEDKLDSTKIQQAYAELKTKALESQHNMLLMAEKRKRTPVKHSPETTGDSLSQLS